MLNLFKCEFKNVLNVTEFEFTEGKIRCLYGTFLLNGSFKFENLEEYDKIKKVIVETSKELGLRIPGYFSFYSLNNFIYKFSRYPIKANDKLTDIGSYEIVFRQLCVNLKKDNINFTVHVTSDNFLRVNFVSSFHEIESNKMLYNKNCIICPSEIFEVYPQNDFKPIIEKSYELKIIPELLFSLTSLLSSNNNLTIFYDSHNTSINISLV